MENSKKIVIGIATYKRPKMLEKALLSLSKIEKPDFVNIEVVVIDNDILGSAKNVVEKVRKNFPFRLHYDIEKRRGIPFARNTIIKKAIKLNATELAFIDDDETVSKDWLIRLFSFYCKNECECVTGPVIPILPSGTSKWMADLFIFFCTKKLPTGTQVSEAYTNNILFSMKVFTERNLRFDEKFALTGGTDTILTQKLTKQGGKIFWVNEALVFETYPKSKVNFRWVFQRLIRYRFNLIEKSLVENGIVYTYFFSSLSFIKFFIYTIISFPLLIAGIFKPKLILKPVRYMANTLAILYGLLGIKYEEYKKKHGY